MLELTLTSPTKRTQTITGSNDPILALDEAKELAQKLAIDVPTSDGFVEIVDTEWGYDIIIYNNKTSKIFANVKVCS